MLQSFRSTNTRLLVQARAFTVGPLLAAKTAATKPKKVSSPAQKSLEKELKKEKATLTKLQVQLKKIEDSNKDKKLEAAKKKREQKALKPYKKLSALNVFVKENYKTIGSLSQASQEWTKLGESEKESYIGKAEKVNAENLKIFTPKPVSPTPAYAKFTKSVWEPTETFAESSKAASKKWRQLTEAEKQSYGPSPEEWDAYRKAYATWRAERLKLFENRA